MLLLPLSDSLIKTLNHLHASAQKLFIGDSLCGPALQDAVDPQCLIASKMFIGKIGIVNGLCHQGHATVTQAETLHQSFKSAVISPVAKAARLEHVKGNCVGMARGVLIKDEARIGVDKAPDQPGGCHAIDPWS